MTATPCWREFTRAAVLCFALLPVPGPGSEPYEMQQIKSFAIDRTEVSIGQFAAFVAATGFQTRAEKEGGGLVYESGWSKKSGWTWRKPYGLPADEGEPAVHVNFDEARAYCRWAGKRLPTEQEWIEAAYTEHRETPPEGFQRGKTYPYPTGDGPKGANCLHDCGPAPAIDYSSVLDRGRGHARVGTTRAGVNGLFDMGANVWEWVDIANRESKGTRGGSWWYGARQMQADYDATKPRGMSVVYIGFRCVKDSSP